MDGGEKAALPVGDAGSGTLPAGLEDHEGGQVLGLGSQAVADPGTHAGAPRPRRPGVAEDLGRPVVEVVGGDGGDERQVVDDGRGVGKALGDGLARLAVRFELPFRTQKPGLLFGEEVHESEALVLQEGIGKWLAVQFPELRLVVEEIQLAGSSHHVEIDDVSDFGGEMGIPGRQGIRQIRFPGEEPPVTEKGGQGDLSQTEGATAEKVPPCLRKMPGFVALHGVHSRVMNSSRFRSTLERRVQAASSCGSSSSDSRESNDRASRGRRARSCLWWFRKRFN